MPAKTMPTFAELMAHNIEEGYPVEAHRLYLSHWRGFTKWLYDDGTVWAESDNQRLGPVGSGASADSLIASFYAGTLEADKIIILN